MTPASVGPPLPSVSWPSVFSLVVMFTTATYFTYELYIIQGFPIEYVLSFVATIYGSGLGIVYELFLYKIPANEFFHRLRVANVSVVMGLLFWVYLRLCYPIALVHDLRFLFLCQAILITVNFSLSYVSYANDASPSLILVVVLEQLLMLVMLYFAPHRSTLPVIPLSIAVLLQILSWADTKVSTIYHLLNSIVGYFLYAALTQIGAKTVPHWDMESLRMVISITVIVPIALFWIIPMIAPKLYSAWRQVGINAIWLSIYTNLVTLPVTPPIVMTENEYTNLDPIRLVPYSSTHPFASQFMFNGADHIPPTQYLGTLHDFVEHAFQLIRTLDRFLPQARATTNIQHKVRLAQGALFAEYYPKCLIAAAGPPPSTSTAIKTAFDQCQTIAYVAQYGHATSMLQEYKENDEKLQFWSSKSSGNQRMIMDFRFMERFSVKGDFCGYGGAAFLEWTRNRQLVLKAILQPGSNPPVYLLPDNKSQSQLFRECESVVLASSLANVVVGRHCAGIHSYFNLVAIAMHNTFDTLPKWNFRGDPIPHPIRLILQAQFYNHILVEELTTGHLLEKNAVFQQIFAFDERGLAEYYNHMMNNIELAEDADLERRIAAFGPSPFTTTNDEQIDTLARSQIMWEQEYHKIFLKYATSIVDVVYSQDDDVKSDTMMAAFRENLRTHLPLHLPTRYGELHNKSTLSRFIADIMFCVCVRHEVYGRISTNYGDDYAIIQGQIPKDHGLPALEDYISLVCVALATSRPHYIPLQQDWTYLLAPLEKSVYFDGLKQAMYRLQDDLTEIQRKWTGNTQIKRINVEYSRPLPQEMCPGSCY